MPKNRPFLRWFPVIVIFAIFTPFWLSNTSQAYACTPPPGGHTFYSLEERVNQAPIILQGHVIGDYFDNSTRRRIAIIEVDAYFKGSGPSIISVGGYGDPQECLSYVPNGNYILFVSRQRDGGLWANYGSVNDAYVAATDQNRASVIEYTRRQPVPPIAEATPNLITLSQADAQEIIISSRLETAVATWSQTPPPRIEIYSATPINTLQTATAYQATIYDIATSTKLTQLAQTDGPDIFFPTELTIDSSRRFTATAIAQQTQLSGTITIAEFDPHGTATVIELERRATASQRVIERQSTATRQAQMRASEVIIDGTGGPSVYRQSLTADAVGTLTAQVPLTASFQPPSPTFTPMLDTASLSDTNSDDSDFVPFVLGFLAATSLFVVFGIGFWLGNRQSKSRKPTD